MTSTESGPGQITDWADKTNIPWVLAYYMLNTENTYMAVTIVIKTSKNKNNHSPSTQCKLQWNL